MDERDLEIATNKEQQVKTIGLLIKFGIALIIIAIGFVIGIIMMLIGAPV